MRIAVAALALLTLAAPAVEAQAIRDNAGFRRSAFPRNDDGSTEAQSLGFTINFFGAIRSSAYVNNNGNITFDAPLATFTPFGLTSTRREIIAPFFGDVDTRGARSALVTYGEDTINNRRAFGVNYVNVGYYGSHDDKLNSFQLVLIDRSDTGANNFDIEFNYERILWETGDASGGENGYGGTPAAVGWSNGTGAAGTFFEFDGSLVSGSFLEGGRFSLSRNRLNTTQRGRYVFRARGGTIQPPLRILTGSPLPSASLETPYRFQLTSEGGLWPYRWTLTPDPGAPTGGFTLSPDGLITGTPTAAGEYSFSVTLVARGEDGDESVSRRFTIAVDPPVLRIATACPLPAATVGSMYDRTFSASGSRGPFTWSLAEPSTLPSGVTLSSAGVLRGIPTAGGVYPFVVRVTSSGPENAVPATRSCTLVVNDPVLDLTASCSLAAGTAGVPYSQNLGASGGRGPYRFAVSGALPLGISLTEEGRLNGIPEVAGLYPFDVIVTDARGDASARTCRLAIGDPAVRITSACPLPEGTTGVPYSQRLSAEGGAGGYRWSLLGALPGGLQLASDGTLSGAPYRAGPHFFRLLVTDSQGNSGAQACSLIVKRAPLSLSMCPLPEGRVGESYSQYLSVEGDSGPFFFSLTGAAPSGLVLNGSGRLSGTPATAGLFPFSVRITDGSGRTAVQSCAVEIAASPLRLTSACPLETAVLGQPYTGRLQAEGGIPSYTFSAIGGLPPGVTLTGNGTLSGTPTERGSFDFVARVTDSRGRASTLECSVAVNLPTLPEIKIIDPPTTVPAASAGPRVGVELARPYPLPIQGTLLLTPVAETGHPEVEVNRADPRLRLNNGQSVVRFTIPAGATRFDVPVATTGTVAASVNVSVTSVEVMGNRLAFVPPSKRFRVPAAAPVLTNACYAGSGQDVELRITGYTTTRELTSAAIAFSRATGQNTTVALADEAYAWFSSELSIPHGGAFTLSLPLHIGGNLSELGDIGVKVSNRMGESAVRAAARCP